MAESSITHSDSMTLGDVEVTRVVEWIGPVRTLGDVVADADEADRARLPAPFRSPDDGFRCAVQTWVLRSGGRTVLVDTGVGNGRDRPHTPAFANWETDFLTRLEEAGVRPHDVDVVVNTHVHADHVGWNTRWDGDGWVTTFPRATYLIPRLDHDHADPTSNHWPAARSESEKLRLEGTAQVFADSIRPVVDAGQAVLWEASHRIDEHLLLTPAPGHTPGSSVLELRSGEDRALFVGDLLHSPVQLARPGASSCFCLDPVAAASTRSRVLTEAADTGSLVVPAHFPGAGAAEIRRDGDGFVVTRWAGLPEV